MEDLKQDDKLTYEHLIFANMFVISNTLQTIGDSFLGEITTKQWFLLATLDFANSMNKKDEDLTLGQLTELMGSSRQNVKQIALKLEEKGFIEIYKDEKDSRVLRLKTTDKSIEYADSRGERDIEFIRSIYRGFNLEEMQALFNSLEKFKNNITEFKNEM